MKKGLLICLLLSSFLLVGCGLKKETEEPKKEEQPVSKDAVLVCSKSTTESSVSFITEMSYYFEDNTPVRLSVKYTYDLSSYTEEQRKIFANSNMCDLDAFKTLGMTDCKEELSGTNYIVEGDANSMITKGSTLELTEKSYKSGGWTCYTK